MGLNSSGGLLTIAFSLCPHVVFPLGLNILGLSCWSKINSRPDISPAKMSIFGISRELRFEVYNHGEPCERPCTGKEGGCFYRGEKEAGVWVGVGLGRQKVHGLSLTESLCEKRPGLPFFSWDLPFSLGVRALAGLLTPFNHLRLLVLIIYTLCVLFFFFIRTPVS